MKNFLMSLSVFLIVMGMTQLVFAGPFDSTLIQNTTGQSDSLFTGAPDDSFWGLGTASVTFDLGLDRVINGAGNDFNVYEVDYGAVEFYAIDVFVSLDNSTFYDVTTSMAAGIRISGDSAHGNDSFFRSYDLGSLSEARYIQIVGLYGGTSPGYTEYFDLDAIGLINYRTSAPVPEPATMLLFGLGLLGLAGVNRRKK